MDKSEICTEFVTEKRNVINDLNDHNVLNFLNDINEHNDLNDNNVTNDINVLPTHVILTFGFMAL